MTSVGIDSRNLEKMITTTEDSASLQGASGMLHGVASIQHSIQERAREEEERSRAGSKISERAIAEEEVKSRSTDRERVRKTIKTSSSRKSEEKEEAEGTRDFLC